MDKTFHTKGKWKLANNEYGYYTSVRNLDDTRKVCVSRVNNLIESNANMLLISKSPLLLQAIFESIKVLRDAGLNEMAEKHEKLYIESITI